MIITTLRKTLRLMVRKIYTVTLYREIMKDKQKVHTLNRYYIDLYKNCTKELEFCIEGNSILIMETEK